MGSASRPEYLAPMSSRRRLLTFLSFALMVGVSAWVVADHAPPGGMPWLGGTVHAALLALVAFEIVTRAAKMQASASACGIPLRFGTACRVCLAGDFAAGVTPARSGAEPARFLVLAEAGIAPPARVLVLFLELFLEMWSLVLVCGGLALLFRGRGVTTAGLLAVVGGYSTFVLGAGAVAWLLARHHAKGPPPPWFRAAANRIRPTVRLHAGHWRTVQRTLRGVRAGVTALRRARWRPMLQAFACSVLHVLAKVAMLPLLVILAAPAHPITLDTMAPLVLWPLALFYGGVAVPAPGGGGFIEGAFAATLSGAIPGGLFAAALLWWRFYTYYLYLLVGALAAGDAARRALRGPMPSPVVAVA